MAKPRFGMGGMGGEFFSQYEICASLCFVRGVRGHVHPEKFFKMLQFGVYFDQILS